MDVDHAAELYRAGLSLRDVAEHLGVAPQHRPQTPSPGRCDHAAASIPGTADAGTNAVTRTGRPRAWGDILSDALADQEAISVRGTVTSHLRRTPTRAEMNAARRAAHGLAASGQATILRVKTPGPGPGVPTLILARPGTSGRSKLIDQLASGTARAADIERFDPTAIVQDLASSERRRP